MKSQVNHQKIASETVRCKSVVESAAKKGDWAACLRACEALLALDARHHYALETLASAHLQLGEMGRAREVMERLLQISPRDALHRMRYATILQMQSENGRALEQFELIAAMYPDAPFTQDARDAVEMLDKMQTSQILMMAAENSEFRWELERNPQSALERAGFRLSENGFENLRHIIPGGTDELEIEPPKVH